MGQFVRTTTVDSSETGDSVKQAVLDVDADLTGIIAAYNTHDTATTDVHGCTGAATGTGALVRATSPTLVTPALGTPSAIVLTNASGSCTLTTVTATSFVGALTGAVTGNVTGDVTGNVTGNVTGDLTGNVTGNVTATTITVSGLTASLPVFTNGSKVLASNAMTGTGSVVMSNSPTLVTPTLGTAGATAVNITHTPSASTYGLSVLSSSSLASNKIAIIGVMGGSNGFTIEQNAAQTMVYTFTGGATTGVTGGIVNMPGTVNMNGLTASLPVFTDGSKNLVSNTMTGTGKVVMDTSPTLVTPNIGAASGTSLTLSGLTASLPVFSDASKKLETKTVLAAVQALYAQPGKTYSLTDGATIAINWNNGATQYVTLGSTGRTVTFANPVDGQVYRFIIIQGSGGSKTITTWPTIKWAGGAAPTLSTTAAYIDIVTLLYCNSVYYGDCAFDFRTPA